MNEAPVQASAIPARQSLVIRSLHVMTLCCFAITQPILIALQGQPVYIRDEHLGWVEMASMLVVLMVALPALLIVIDRLVVWLSRRVHGYGRNFVLFVLFDVIFLSLIRPYMSVEWLMREGMAGFSAIAITAPCALALSFFYDRVSWLRSWISFASIGLIVFPGMFLWNLHLILQPDKDVTNTIVSRSPTNVVFIVFDEFSATTLMNENLEIDIEHFPNFGRLASVSTWYRKMTTVHPRTGTAVPAILSGRFPVTELLPLASEFPGNLFEVIVATRAFDSVIFEPATRIASPSLRKVPEPEPEFTEKLTQFLYTLATVYPRLIVTRDTPVYFPVIPSAWFGIDLKSMRRRTAGYDLTEGLFTYNRQQGRHSQFEHFVRCLIRSERPRFQFIHAMIPHYPWCYYPDGTQYVSDFNFYSLSPAGAHGDLGEDWPNDALTTARYEARYRMQLSYVDRFVGQVLDRLREIGRFDETMIIVTADHGVAFEPGHSRRQPDAENMAEILSVPLFIKLPGQSEGSIDDRNVESVDLLPTLAEQLGIELPEPVDGLSVSENVRRPRKALYYGATSTIIEPDFPQLPAAVRRRSAQFVSLPPEKLPDQAMSRPAWVGRPLADFKIKNPPALYDALDPEDAHFFKKNSLVRGLIAGLVSDRQIPESCRDIVMAVDGVILDSTHPVWESGQNHYFELLIPRSKATAPASNVELFWVEESKGEITLRPLRPVGVPQ